MAKPPYLEEDCMKDYKLKNHSHKAKNNLSFLASIFSLFIYLCIFYIFNLSPYTLLNKNIFWFLMSNTLILIIAIDYEAFSSSKQKQLDLYEEYVEHSQAKNHVSSYVIPTYDEQVDHKQCINSNELLKEKKENISSDEIIPERVLEIVVQNQQPKKPSEEKKSILGGPGHQLVVTPSAPLHSPTDDDHRKIEENRASIYKRSKSYRHNRTKHVVSEEKKVRRLEAMKKMEPKVEEENEFSSMTNEDLNRRVEEFIQKFNRQIRLQATRNVYQI